MHVGDVRLRVKWVAPMFGLSINSRLILQRLKVEGKSYFTLELAPCVCQLSSAGKAREADKEVTEQEHTKAWCADTDGTLSVSKRLKMVYKKCFEYITYKKFISFMKKRFVAAESIPSVSAHQ
jgi:hypothetical protein